MIGKLGLWSRVQPLQGGGKLFIITTNDVRFYDSSYNLLTVRFSGKGYITGVRLKNGKYAFSTGNNTYDMYNSNLAFISNTTVSNLDGYSFDIASLDSDSNNRVFMARHAPTTVGERTINIYDDSGNFLKTIPSGLLGLANPREGMTFWANGCWGYNGRNFQDDTRGLVAIYNSVDTAVLTRFYGSGGNTRVNTMSGAMVGNDLYYTIGLATNVGNISYYLSGGFTDVSDTTNTLRWTSDPVGSRASAFIDDSNYYISSGESFEDVLRLDVNGDIIEPPYSNFSSQYMKSDGTSLFSLRLNNEDLIIDDPDFGGGLTITPPYLIHEFNFTVPRHYL